MNDINSIRKTINVHELHEVLQSWKDRNAKFLEMRGNFINVVWDKKIVGKLIPFTFKNSRPQLILKK